MVAAQIKGITISIGGDTSPLQKALKEVDSTTRSLQTELRSVEKLLKFNPADTVLLAQKQNLLAEQIKNTSNKLDILKQAEIQAQAEFKKGNVTEAQYRDLQRQIIATEQSLSKTTAELKNMNTQVNALDSNVNSANSELKKTDTNLEQINKNTAFTALVSKAQLAVGAIKGLATGVINLITKSAELADNIDETSQKIGISAESYQELTYVLGQSGANVNDLQGNVRKLTDQMVAASKGNTDAIQAFRTLKVSVTDANGQLRSQEEVLWKTFEALQGVKNQTLKANLAVQLFGKSGTELMPLLNGASGSIEEMKKRAHELGLVLSDESIAQGAKFADQLAETKDIAGAVGTELGIELMPAIQEILDTIKENMPEIKAVLSDVFLIVATLINFILDYGKPLTAILAGILTIWLAFKFVALIEFMQAGITGMKGMITTIATLGTTIDPVYVKVAKWVLLIGAIVAIVAILVKGIKELIKVQNESKALDIASATGNYSALKAVNGSHANGLANVPFNGYIAELHEGERVLTKQENQSYSGNGGNTDALLSKLIDKVDNFQQQLYKQNWQNQAVAKM